MAIAYDNQSQYQFSANVSHTIGSGSDRILLAFVFAASSENGVTFSGATYNSTAMTLLDSFQGAYSASEANFMAVYYMLESSLPSTGAYSFSASLSGHWVAGCHVISLDGCYQGSPEANQSYYDLTNSISSYSNNLTTLTDGAWLVDGISIWDANTLVADGSQTRRGTDVSMYGNYNGGISTREVATAGSTAMGWTFTDGSYITMQEIVSIAPAGGTPAVTHNAPFMGMNF